MSETNQANETQTETPPNSTSTEMAPPKSQRFLLMFVLVGFSFAGWYGWQQRDDFLRFFGKHSKRGVINTAGAFDVSNAIVPQKEILSGGVAQDGIPSISEPIFVTAAKATFLKPNSKVIGVYFEGKARAYPLSIMDSHEAVNDRIGETSFAVTYCPLCDSSAVYNRKTEQGEIEFGISGMLYNSNVLLYDRNSKDDNKKNSLWSQMMFQSVAGPRVKEQLATLPLEVTTWEDWKKRYPDTKVLTTPHPPQSRNPHYQSYFATDELMFPVNKEDKRLPKKTPVFGVWVGETMRAYPMSAFGKITEPLELKQELAGKKFTLMYNPQAKSLRIIKGDDGLQWVYSFWFAWYAFHPQTELFDATMLKPAS